MKNWLYIAWCVVAGLALSVSAQSAVDPVASGFQPLSDPQLDQLLGPIALYPDPLIALILPAATLPAQIVQADRYVSGGGDPNLIDQQGWDPNVQGLTHYPGVLQWLDQNLDWTTELGQAFLNQQPAVMDSIQRLRQTALNLGNLQSTPQQEVINDGGYIEIIPVNPQVVYVPVYEPEEVYDLSAPNGLPYITFGPACAIGPWLDCDFDWINHNLIFWNQAHPRPANWWRTPLRRRDLGHATVWHSGFLAGGAQVIRGDRGWGQPAVASNRRVPIPAIRTQAPAFHAPSRPAPAPEERSQAASRPESNGAFIGVDSSRETQAYSDRGRQSLQAFTRPEPAPAPRPSFGGGGGGSSGGGGGHGPRR